MAAPAIRVLVVEDFGAFLEINLFDTWEKTGITDRRRGLRRIRSRSESRGTSAGLDFVGYRAATLGGIEAARRIRKLPPESLILFVSQNTSVHVVQGALCRGS